MTDQHFEDEYELCDCGMQGCVSNLFRDEYSEMLSHIPRVFVENFAKAIEFSFADEHSPESEFIFDDYTDDLDFDNPDWVLWEWEFAEWQKKKSRSF